MATLGETLGLAAVPPQEEQPYPFAPSNLPMQPAPPDVGGSLETGLSELTQQQALERQVEEMAAVRRAQAASLTQHAQYAQGLQQQQSQVDLQSADLALAERMSKIFAPDTPSAARDILLNREARNLGIDPKGESFRELKQMIRGLERNPDNLAALRSSFIRGGIETAPGEFTEMTRAAFSGRADPLQFLDMIRASQPAPVQRPAGMMRLGGPTEEEAAAAPTNAATPSPANLPPLQRPAPPSLVQRFGLDPARPWTMQDLVERGYTGPTSEAGAQRFLSGTSEKDTGLEGRDATAMELSRSLLAAEGILNEAGSAATRFFPSVRITWPVNVTLTPPNWSELIAGTGRLLNVNPDNVSEPATGRSRADRNARLTTELDGHLSSAVFLIGKMAGQGGQALSDADREMFMQQLNTSTNPEARLAVMRNTLDRVFTGLMANREGVPLDVASLPPEGRQAILASSIMPRQMVEAVRAYEARLSGQQPTSQPTQAGVSSPISSSGPNQSPIPPTQNQSPIPPSQNTATAAPPPAAENVPPAGMNRAERQEWFQRQRNAEDRAAILQGYQQRLDAELRAREQFQQGTPFQRAQIARQEMHRAQDKFQHAMERVGAMLASGRSGGGGSSGSTPSGGEQDPNAFKMTPIQRRPAPQIRLTPPPRLEIPSFRK